MIKMCRIYPGLNLLAAMVFIFLGNFQIAAQMNNNTSMLSKEQQCMKKIIALDDSLGRFRNLQCLVDPLSKTIADYTFAVNNLDFSNCPEAFRSAFSRHARAWNDLLPVVRNYPDSRGEMHALFKDLERSRDSLSFNAGVKKVWDTWAEIEVFVK